jgi:hypothetical protein
VIRGAQAAEFRAAGRLREGSALVAAARVLSAAGGLSAAA